MVSTPRLRLVALAAASLLAAPCWSIDTLRGNRALSAAGGPILSIGYAPLNAAGTAERPACLKPAHTGEPEGQASNWINSPAAHKEAAAAARDVFKTLSAKIDNILKIFSYGVGIYGRNEGGQETKSETVGDWTAKDVPMLVADVTHCDFLIPQQASLGYKKNLAQLKAVDALLLIKESLMAAVNPRLDVGKKVEDVDTCMGGSTAAAIAASKQIPGHIETLAAFLEKDMVDHAERSLFRHLDEYWKGALLLEHSAVCPADWVEEFSDNRSGGRGTLTWETWTALAPAARCWKWYKTLFAEMATLLRASFKAPEWDEYANWALSLCMRPKQAAEDCKADAALVTHLQETLSTVKPEVKAFFAKTASAPAPEKPESLVKVAAGIKAVEVPKWPSEGEAKAISLYAGIKVAVDQMINTAAPEKGYQVNYVKWRALVQKAAADWSAKDEAAYKDWSAKQQQGPSAVRGIEVLPHWTGKESVPRARRRLAMEHAVSTINAVFWSKDAAERESYRGEKATAAQEWLKGKAAERAKAVAAAATRDAAAAKAKADKGKGGKDKAKAADKDKDKGKDKAAAAPATSPVGPGYIDCVWKPTTTDVKKAHKEWIEYLDEAAAKFVFTDQPLASCMPLREQWDEACTPLAVPKFPGFFF